MQSSIDRPARRIRRARYIAFGKAVGARQQQFASSSDEHHHRRRHARINDVSARRTLLGSLVRLVHRGRPAATAVAVAAIPFDNLEGAAGQREQRIGNLQEQ
jgi:hypothetical protein